jgi:hypothetical protein
VLGESMMIFGLKFEGTSMNQQLRVYYSQKRQQIEVGSKKLNAIVFLMNCSYCTTSTARCAD